MARKRLLLGSGHSRPEGEGWVTLDNNEASNPDVLFDLESIERSFFNITNRLPFEDGEFHELYANHVLEHFGRQGDFRGFFSTFREFWRVLKPNGAFFGAVPRWDGKWAWGDPGHTRVITRGTLLFLTRGHYDGLGSTTSSDYRALVDPCWWELADCQEGESDMKFVLVKQ